MDTTRIMELAGVPASEHDTLYEALTEVVQLPDPEDISIDDLVRRMEHCKRALSLCAKLPEKDRKKWLSAVFVNMNKIRGALQRMLAAQPNADVAPIKTKQAFAPETPPEDAHAHQLNLLRQARQSNGA